MNEGLVVAIRGIIGFVTLLIFARFLGKQQVSQLTFFEYVLGITIGSIAATLTTDLDNRAWSHWVGLFVWALAVYVIQWVTLSWVSASKYLTGEPVMVIMNGRIMEDAMRQMRYRINDLLEQLRHNGVFDLTEVEFAVLETDGQLSVLKKSQYQPLTPKDINMPTAYKGMSSELIYDGVVVGQNLEQLKLDRAWLDGELEKRGIKDPKEVFLATLDTEGVLFIDKYKDCIKNPTDIND